MLRLMMILLFFLTGIASAQNAEITVETEGSLPSVKIWYPPFEGMCQGFAKKLSPPQEVSGLILKPKPLLPSRERYLGNEWLVMYRSEKGEGKIEVKSTDLPPILQKIKGPMTKMIFQVSCYLRDLTFFSTEDVVILTLEKEDARTIAAILR